MSNIAEFLIVFIFGCITGACGTMIVGTILANTPKWRREFQRRVNVEAHRQLFEALRREEIRRRNKAQSRPSAPIDSTCERLH